MSKIKVVKIGGNVIDSPEVLDQFLWDFAKMSSPKILVHGGGKLATRLAEKLGIETKMIDGRRVTDKDTLDVVVMTYAGLINKRIVAKLQSLGCNAIGLSGADGNIIPATRRPSEPIDFGYVGDVDYSRVSSRLIGDLLDSGVAPIFCSITHDDEGTLLNCNADTIASAVAIAASRLTDTELIYCFEKKGVLRDVDDEDSVIDLIYGEYDFERLKAEGVISKGMLPKIENAINTIDNSHVSAVYIKHSEDLLKKAGTKIITSELPF